MLNELSKKGILLRSKRNYIFFGNQYFNPKRDLLSVKKTQYIHQVHGDHIIAASDSLKKADAHFTTDKSTALVIKTADCMPVFISSSEKVMAIHIGWRGLKQKIFTKTISHFNKKKEAEIYIGPHIHYNSFQLDYDSAESLFKPHQLNIATALKLRVAKVSNTQTDHLYICLKSLINLEFRQAGIKENQIFFDSVNTYTSPHHYSHRRCRQRLGQNYSFIIKN